MRKRAVFTALFCIWLILSLTRFPCPCCGYLVFRFEPGSHKLCPICAWEDNLVQLRFPLMVGGANRVSLLEAQQNYEKYGYSSRDRKVLVSEPLNEVRRDPQWRCLDVNRDNPELPQRGIPYADSYPESDFTVLYYWRDNYWRRLSS